MDDPTPPPERPPEPSRPRGSCLGVLMVGMLISTALFALNLITMNVFGMVALIGAAILMFSLFHYLVWGWWLGRMIRSEVEAEDPSEDEEGWS